MGGSMGSSSIKAWVILNLSLTYMAKYIYSALAEPFSYNQKTHIIKVIIIPKLSTDSIQSQSKSQKSFSKKLSCDSKIYERQAKALYY